MNPIRMAGKGLGNTLELAPYPMAPAKHPKVTSWTAILPLRKIEVMNEPEAEALSA